MLVNIFFQSRLIGDNITPRRLSQTPTPAPRSSESTLVTTIVYIISREKRATFPTLAVLIDSIFRPTGCLNFQSFGGSWSGLLLQSQIQSVFFSIHSASFPLQLMQTPLSSSSTESSVLGLLGGDFGLPLRLDARLTLAEELVLSLWASFSSLRYSSAAGKGRGVVRSGLRPISTQDSMDMGTKSAPTLQDSCRGVNTQRDMRLSGLLPYIIAEYASRSPRERWPIEVTLSKVEQTLKLDWIQQATRVSHPYKQHFNYSVCNKITK